MTAARRRPRILVVDDDDAHRAMLAALLTDLGAAVDCAENGRLALESMAAAPPALVLLDMRMPELDGLGTLRQMQARDLAPPTVVLTAYADLDEAVTAMKLGARDYLRKPIDIASLQGLVAELLGSGTAAPTDRGHPPLPDGVEVHSPLMHEVCRDLARVADSDAAVLFLGETGTGKDVLAGLLHRWSPRRGGPFVAVNLAAVPEALVESELFGHRKGAFTGADATRSGRFQQASGGTLFLDEIGDMPPPIQPKLLRVLQGHRVTMVGDTREQQVDFRLVSATHRDLEAEIQRGRFRQDLYYRIAVITLEIPPLRERPEDIAPLARRFLRRAEGPPRRLSPAATDALQRYRWPGNVRELQNAMLRAAILAPGDVILPTSLPPAVQAAGHAGQALHEDPLTLAAAERRAIEAALERTGGNRSEAARLLGISRRKLVYRVKEYREAGG